MDDRTHRFFRGLLAHPFLLGMGVLLLTLVLGWLAAGVKTDFSIENVFPQHTRSRIDYERFKALYPHESGRALVMVEASDLWEPSGLARLGALEEALEGLPGVEKTDGPRSALDISATDDGAILIEELFPEPLPGEAELEARRRSATSDPMFAWRVAPPSGEAAIIWVTITPEQAADASARNQFLDSLRQELARHQADGQRITISGIPIIRSEYTEMILADQLVTTPLALLVILVLLYASFRSLREVLASLITIALAIVWTRGAMGLLGYSEQMLTSVTPVIVMIISISDTVHIVSHYKERLAERIPAREALVEALGESAWPCLLTEVAIAAGFASFAFFDMEMISQFGVATACGMLLTWLANMTALPLFLGLFRPAAATRARRSRLHLLFARFVAWIEAQVVERPRRVAVVAALICAAALVCALNLGREFYAYDDLREGSPIDAEMRYAERMVGGLIPLVIFLEPRQGESGAGGWPEVDSPMLAPEILRLADRLACHLEVSFPDEVRNAQSIADPMKKLHAALAGEERAARDPLPDSRQLAVQELFLFDDGRTVNEVIDPERRTAVVLSLIPDVGSTRTAQMMAELRPHLEEEERRLAKEGFPVEITLTGFAAVWADVYDELVGGLLKSLATAVLASFVVFCIVLRSWRLGLIALVPNLIPLLITFAFMGVFGIDLTPTTVLAFTTTLVIADDDTIQYLARFRVRFFAALRAGEADPYAAAALGTLRATGLPMFITSSAVCLGFLVLTASDFLGLAKLGLLIGVSLFAAVFADLFLAPLLLMGIRPRLGSAPPPAPPAG